MLPVAVVLCATDVRLSSFPPLPPVPPRINGLNDTEMISFTGLRGTDGTDCGTTSSISARALKSGPVSRPLVIFSKGRTTDWMGIAQQGISGLSTMTLGRFGDASTGALGAAPKTSGGKDLEWRPNRPFRDVVSMLGMLKIENARCAVVFSVVVSELTPVMSKVPAISWSLFDLSKLLLTLLWTPGSIHGGTTEGVNGQVLLWS